MGDRTEGWLEYARTRQDISALPICELIEDRAPADPDFWCEFAGQLHQEDLHEDALDAWHRAVELAGEDGAGEIWDASAKAWDQVAISIYPPDESRVTYAQRAIDAATSACVCNPTESRFLKIADLLCTYEHDELLALSWIERALDFSASTAPLEWGDIHGEDFSYFDQPEIRGVTGYPELIEAYLDREAYERAGRALSKARKRGYYLTDE